MVVLKEKLPGKEKVCTYPNSVKTKTAHIELEAVFLSNTSPHFGYRVAQSKCYGNIRVGLLNGVSSNIK